ncbi:MAG: hypothetical protein K2W94_02350 [Alphaproteobacteria bacterium]|nr:hypothetical protein [Alphaproteobacteria bacterium]MCI5059332.1 hypothetical protein [Flavobacteriales bacterium]
MQVNAKLIKIQLIAFVRTKSQRGFFDIKNRLQILSEFGDPLEKLASIIDFESFHKAIEEVINFSNKEKGEKEQ